EMTGYPGSPTGYPSNLQPALAVAADSGIANAANAWSVFDGRTVKPGTDGTPDYNTDPQFAIVPR
ncbi:MAG TPA: hypothetical protein VKA50_07980, partial [Gammaproteobacteria bacterium]|nr:hypothetical protein [Gammaproteobacteria bacterium]